MEVAMKLTKSERMELQQQAAARNGRADSARHARLILLLADGLTWAEIRAKLDCSDSFIDRWSKRFESDRLAGLFARHAGRERYTVASHNTSIRITAANRATKRHNRPPVRSAMSASPWRHHAAIPCGSRWWLPPPPAQALFLVRWIPG